jgi:hypothetical protein
MSNHLPLLLFSGSPFFGSQKKKETIILGHIFKKITLGITVGCALAAGITRLLGFKDIAFTLISVAIGLLFVFLKHGVYENVYEEVTGKHPDVDNEDISRLP